MIAEKNPGRPREGTWRIASAVLLLVLACMTFSFALEDFTLSSDKGSYYPNQDVYLIVAGPGDSSFVVDVVGPRGEVVVSERGKTSPGGNSYIHLEGFSLAGKYEARLLYEGNVKAVASFRIEDPYATFTSTSSSQAKTTTTATSSSVPQSSFTVTTSLVSPTTPTTTVVTTGGWEQGLVTDLPTPSTDYGDLPAVVKSVDYSSVELVEKNPETILVAKKPDTCFDGKCLATISGGGEVLDQSGASVDFTDAVSFSWADGRFKLSWLNNSLEMPAFMVYNGRRYGLDEMKDMYPSISAEGIVKDNKEGYKYALNLSGIPQEVADGLGYVGLDLPVKDSRVRQAENGFIVVNDEIGLGFSDLLMNNFTVSFNGSSVLIGNVRDQTSLFLDPTVQLQTNGTENLRDAHVYSWDADTAYGGYNYLYLRDRTTRRGRMYLMFNMSSIPANVSVDDAQVCLYLYSNGATAEGSIYHVTDDSWDGETEGSITWNNQVCGVGFDDASDCNLTAEDTQSTDAETWICWNVTQMVSREVAASDSAVSVVIKSPETAGSSSDQFCSKESTAGDPAGCSVALRPYLNISYTDLQAPRYSNLSQSPSGNPTYGFDVECNSSWLDNVELDAVIFRSNYTGSWQNYTPSNSSYVYNYSIPYSQLTGGEVVGWYYWANDSSGNWNKSMSVQSFTVQKANATLSLYLNGTEGDFSYYQNDSANFTATLDASGKSLELWTNLSGGLQLWDSGTTPLTNITVLDYPYGSYLIKANFSGDENYTSAEVNYTLTIAQDPIPPVINGVSPINSTVGIGAYVTVSANVTDNIEVDSVRLNLTPPGGGSQIYAMSNATPDIYTYSFYAWEAGDYYYEILANDTSGNLQVYHPYIYVRGNASVGVSTLKDTYAPGEDVNLSSPGVSSSGDLEDDVVSKEGLLEPPVWLGLTYDDFDNGLWGNWVSGGADAIMDATISNCGATTHSVDLQDDTGSAYTELSAGLNLTGYTDVKVDFYAYYVSIEAGECLDLYCGGAVAWSYCAGDMGTNDQWVHHEVNLSDGVDCDFNSSTMIRFEAEFSNGLDDAYLDCINISATPGPTAQTEANSSYNYYNDSLAGDMAELEKLVVSVYVSAYNNSGSLANANTDPDLWLELFDGSSWVGLGALNVSSSGNISVDVTDPALISAWASAGNRDVRLKGVYLDYYNSTAFDGINWTGIWVTLYNGSALWNTGSTNISGYLVLTVEENSTGSWQHLATVLNDTDTMTLRNISSGGYIDFSALWNADPWNTNTSNSGFYRAYAALADPSGNVLSGDDGDPLEGYDIFELSVFGDVNASPETVGYGQNVSISAEVLDSSRDAVFVYVARPGEGYTGYEMTAVGGDLYEYNYSNTWKWGDYLYYVRANNSGGFNSTTQTYEFYVRANVSIAVKTENDSYGPSQDVNLVANETDWWNTGYRYRKQLTIENQNQSLVMEEGYSIKAVVDTASLISSGKLQPDCDDLRVAWYNGSSWTELDRVNESSCNSATTEVWFATQENLSAGGSSTSYYLYYDNPSAVNPPENRSNVYIWWDDFSTNTLALYNQSKWVDIHGNPIQYTAPAYDAVNGRVTFDTGDNFASDIYPAGVTAKDFLMEVDFYITGSYPDNATIALIGRLENPGVASTHYYFDYSAQSGYTSPGITIDSWTLGERNHLVYDEAVDYYFPWDTLHNVKYALYGTTHEVWINDEVTDPADLYATDANHTSAGQFGFAPAQAIGWLDNFKVRGFVGTDPSVSLAAEEDLYSSRAYNLGSTNISGYLEMRVQRYSAGSWINFEPAFVNDRLPPVTQRDMVVGSNLMLDSIWNPEGWDTNSNPPGTYRAFVRLLSPTGSVLVNDDSSAIQGWYVFEIASSYMELTSVEHENNYSISLDEYETGDNIAWINVTVINRNTSTINASITLNVLDLAAGNVSWGPQLETAICGNLGVNESCEERFDNSTAGYPIPLDASSGGYTFYWNVTMASDTGAATQNSSLYFRLHHIPDNTSSTLAPGKIFQNQSAKYNFTLTNPWSLNLTDINVTLECPGVAGLNCSCAATGLPYCSIPTLGSGASYTFEFNISTNSTPPGDYSLNATLNYTNPGGESHSWPLLGQNLLMVRIPGQFVVIASTPASIVRNEYGNLSGYSNNTLGSSMHNVSLYWNLPSGWTNSSGNLVVFDPEQTDGEMIWNNMTASPALSSSLGSQAVELRSNSSEGYEDWDTKTITVYARSFIVNLNSNDTDPGQGDSVRVSGQLRLDNGTVLSGRTVSLYDENDSVLLGSDVTNALGWFYIDFDVSGSASLGKHVLNATFSGIPVSYYLGAESTTNITVHTKPVVVNVSDLPDPQGYGYNISLQANATDGEGIDSVLVCITPPSAAETCYEMTNSTPDIYSYKYSSTWTWGNYSYYVRANNTAGKVSTSDTYQFHVGADMTLNVKTLLDAYGPGEDVNLSSTASWWNYSWDYRREINITENNNTPLTDYVVNVTLDTQSLIAAGKMQSDCGDIRLVQNNVLLNYSVKNATCDTGATQIQFEVDLAAGASDSVYLYYSNSQAENTESVVGYHADADTVFIYHLEEGSGVDVTDSSGNGNNATLIRGPAWTSDSRFGEYAINTPGDNEYIEEGASMDVDDGTLELWFKLDENFNSSSAESMGLFGIWGGANNNLYASLCGSDNGDVNCPAGGLAFKIEAPGTGTDWCTATTTSWNASQWYHLAVTWDGATRNIYIDGVLEASCADDGISDIVGADLYIGAAQIDEIDGDPVKYFTGNIDEVRGSSIARSATELLSREDEPSVSFVGSEQDYLNQSLVYNGYSQDVKGYLLMKVQRYSAGSWADVVRDNPVVDDVSSREFNSYANTALDSIWKGGGGWNTDKEPIGVYRVYAELQDPAGNVLKNDDGSEVVSYYEFNITNPASIIQLQGISIYDVSSAADKKTDSSFLMGSGLNTNFNLFTNKTYRVEFEIWNNDSSESNWSITSSDLIFHEGLNSTWDVNASGEIWYSNASSNFTGGSWSSGKITWNTSLNGSLKVNDSMTFYYIFNVSTMDSDVYPVHFVLNDSLFTLEDYSTFDVVLSEDQPPRIYMFIYDITELSIHRNESMMIYGRWDEAISQALAEFDSTSPTLANHSISLPAPNTENWTNYTLAGNSSWLLGSHSVKIYASDLNSNWNNTLPYYSFDVWGWSSILDSSLSSATITNGSAVTMYCQVTSDNGSAISGYNVSFYNSTGLLGVNQTNASGWAQLTFTDYSLGYENITCNITDYAAIYHTASTENERTETIRTIETSAPWYVNVSSGASKVHRGENISLSAYWYDDVWLDYAWLESNESGTLQNNSLSARLFLDADEGVANFTAEVPSDALLGPMAWRIYANDSSSNENKTSPFNYTDIWGYAIVNDSGLSPGAIYVNETSTMSCLVVDYHNGSFLENYNVSFYSNETGFLGTNQTNASGWAQWTYNDTTQGYETLTCNITSDPGRYYDPGTPDSSSKVLRAALPGEDVQAPGASIYALNDTSIWKGESVLAYARWNESVGNANITYNTSSSALEIFTPDTIAGNWTNHTISTNSGWTVGTHFVKINASDNWGNWNNSLSYLTFDVWGRSKVAWYSPTTDQLKGTIPLQCRVYDLDSNAGIGSYRVDFYNSSWDYLGMNTTNASGVATLNHDLSAKDVGQKTFYCMIVNSGFYNTTGADDDASGSFDLLDVLNVSVESPTEGSIYHIGDTVSLNSITRDSNGLIVSPVSASWQNTTHIIASGENTTRIIPVGHSIGPETIKVNVSKEFYSPAEDNVSIEIWGYSNVSWISPVTGSNASSGSTVSLTCRAIDANSSSGIENYPVSFYYKNSTEGSYHYLGQNLSNPLGNAVYSWDTSGLGMDNYTVMCNITDNASVYYNVSSAYQANATVELVTAGGKLEVHLVSPPYIPGLGDAESNGGFKVGQNKTFVLTANVTCRNAACGLVQGTVRYNVTADPDTAINTVSATPFYIVDAPAQNPLSCANNPLDLNESCVLNWTINASGALHSYWKLDVEFEGASAVTNDTDDTTIHITKVLILHVSANSIDWGVLDPQTTCNSAPPNPVNISLDPNSNDADGVYIKGADLENGSEAIGAGNVTWGKVDNCAMGSDLTGSWVEVRDFTAAGTSQEAYFWIDIPAVPALRYHGYSYVMANTTA